MFLLSAQKSVFSSLLLVTALFLSLLSLVMSEFNFVCGQESFCDSLVSVCLLN